MHSVSLTLMKCSSDGSWIDALLDILVKAGYESFGLNRFIPVTPKPENDVRLQATLDNQDPAGLPVGAVRESKWL